MSEAVVEHRIEKTLLDPFNKFSVKSGSVGTSRYFVEKIFAYCPTWVGTGQFRLGHVVLQNLASQIHLDQAERQHIDVIDTRQYF